MAQENTRAFDVQKVSFTSEGETLKGHLFTPSGAQGKLPVIVVTGSWTTVKEQMPDLYAKRLAAAGFAALTFDFRYYGESGGQPRNYEMPADKVTDIVNAVEYLKRLPNIDPERIGGLGICLSAGSMAAAAVENNAIKVLALIAPGLQDKETLVKNFGSEAELQKRIDAGDAAWEKYEATGDVEYIPVVSSTDVTAAVKVPDNTDYYLDPTRGAIPEWTNQFAVMSWSPWAKFDSVIVAKDIRIPTLIVHSETGANPDAAKHFYADLTAPKEVYWMPGTQYDFYDQEPQVTKASSAAIVHFQTTL
jgi:alpha/beta superfamily hydrolase